MTSATRVTLSRLPLMLIAGGFTCPLPAQETGITASEEIIVTARKREQNVRSIGLTMTTLDQEAILSLSADDLPDLTDRLANVELFDDYGGHGLPTWVIRGVGLQDFNANNTPTAAVYLDEVYQAYNVMSAINLFDMERVEVLKGPQGGLYGRNTSGGAITMQTTRPIIGEHEGYARLGYSRWQTLDFEAASNVRLGDNTALRIAGNHESSQDAWQKSLVDGSTHGEKDLWNLRAWLLAEPTPDTRIQWKVQGGANQSELNLGRAVGLYSPAGGLCEAVLAGRRDDENCLTLAGVAAASMGQEPVYPAVQADDGSTSLSQPINQLDNEYAGSTLIIDHDFRGMRLTSVSNIESFAYGADMDFDGTPLELGHSLANSDIGLWSQELRLTSTTDAPLSWILGTTYSQEEFEEDRTFRLRDSFVSPLQIGLLRYDQDTRSLALFGNMNYRFNDEWQLNATLRYTDEEKEYRNGRILAPAFPPPLDVQASGLSSDYSLDSHFSGNIGLDWQTSEDLLIYGSISRGFKAGGFFGGFPLNPGAIDPYEEETVIAYEVGFKSRLTESLLLDAAVFHYDYRDVQGYVTRFSPVTGTDLEFLSNQGDAEHQGLEVEMQWSPAPGLTFIANAGYLDARITDSRSETTNLLGQLVPVEGRRPYAPEWSFFGAVEYSTSLTSELNLRALLDYNYRSDFSGHLSSPADRAVFQLDGYGLFNGSLFLTPESEDWRVSVWARNLTDEQYVPRVVFDSFGDYIDIPGTPGSWGLRFEVFW